MLTERERTEGQLIRLTDEMANLALSPLTRESADTLRHLAAKVTKLTEGSTGNVDVGA